jgi:hypothetical protein
MLSKSEVRGPRCLIASISRSYLNLFKICFYGTGRCALCRHHIGAAHLKILQASSHDGRSPLPFRIFLASSLAQTRSYHSTRPLPRRVEYSTLGNMETLPSSDALAMASLIVAHAEHTQPTSASDTRVNVHCSACETHLGIFENEWYDPCAQSFAKH